MKPSNANDVATMYDETAASYAEMMDSEISLPIYSDLFEKLQTRIEAIPGLLIDTSCGSGHMLSLYHQRYDKSRPLMGIDLSASMVSIAKERLGQDAEIVEGDMRDLSTCETESAAAVVSFFAIHHLDAGDTCKALTEWHRVLKPGGQLLIAAWEGQGAIDYGSHSDIVALRYTAEQLAGLAVEAGFTVNGCAVEPVDGMSMDAIYLEAGK